MLGIEPELAVSFVSNTIAGIDHCKSADIRLQLYGTPIDLVSVVAMTDWLDFGQATQSSPRTSLGQRRRI